MFGERMNGAGLVNRHRMTNGWIHRNIPLNFLSLTDGEHITVRLDDLRWNQLDLGAAEYSIKGRVRFFLPSSTCDVCVSC